MFLATRPSRRTIERFLEESQALPFSYEPIGAAQHEPVGYDVDETIVSIGRGPTDFDRAKAALSAWKHFDIGWMQAGFVPLLDHAPCWRGSATRLFEFSRADAGVSRERP